MKLEDKAIKFDTKILEIKKVIKEIKSLEVDTTELETIIEEIQKEAETERKAIYKKYDQLDTEVFLKESLEKIYDPKIKKLDRILDELVKEYDIYYQLNHRCMILNEKLKEKDNDHLPEYIKQIKKIVKDFEETSIVDYNIKKKIIETIYQLVYLAIKIELMNQENSTLMEYIKLSNINASYIEEFISKEIESLNSSNQEVNNRVKELRLNGLNFSYLDTQLIKLLMNSKENKIVDSNFYFDQFLEYYEELEYLLKKIEQTNQESSSLERELENKRYQQRTYLKNGMIRNFFLVGYISTIIGAFTITNMQAKKDSTIKKYYTTIKKYDVAKDMELPSETIYEESNEDTVKIIQYHPWEKSSWWEENVLEYEKFTREIQIYDVSTIHYDSLKEYTTLDLTKLGIPADFEREEKESLTPSDLYEDFYTIIEKSIHDQNKVQEELDENSYKNDMIFFSIFILGMHALFSISSNKELIIKLIKDTIDSYKKSKNTKQTVKTLKETLSYQKQAIYQLKIEYEQLMNRTEKEYQKLPSFIKKQEDIQDIMKKIRTK